MLKIVVVVEAQINGRIGLLKKAGFQATMGYIALATDYMGQMSSLSSMLVLGPVYGHRRGLMGPQWTFVYFIVACLSCLKTWGLLWEIVFS